MIYTVNNTNAIGVPVDVFVNGNLVKYPSTADTDRGVVVYYPDPIRVTNRGDAIYTRKLKGVVTVKPINNR